MARLFVYGTLRAGLPANARLGADARAVQHNYILKGFRLYNYAGRFPFAVPADQYFEITGDLFEIADAKLAELDEYEGVEEGLFRREFIPSLGAYIYVRGEAGPGDHPPIVSGDWKNRD